MMTPQEQQKRWIQGLRGIDHRECSLDKAFMMVIPDEGVIIPCQRHPKGHFLAPTIVRMGVSK